jgi:hypothetical protein
LTAYESQRRLTRNFLEGARRKRISYTPRGLWEAWVDLDAAMKVYIGSILGMIISVSTNGLGCTANLILASSFPPSCCSSARAASTAGTDSLAKTLTTTRAAEALNGTPPRHEIETLLTVSRIPSIFVQLFWSVVVGPWILWKIRHIKDVHSWAWQSRLAIIAG